jgi:hypothetical protein
MAGVSGLPMLRRHAPRLAELTLEAAVEGLLGVKAQGDRHVQNRFVAVG